MRYRIFFIFLFAVICGQNSSGFLRGKMTKAKTVYDAYWAYVGLYLPLNGLHNSTTFSDVSSSPKTVTPTGQTKISTDQYKFGGASAYFDGSGDYLSVSYDPEVNLATGDFTIEFWMRPETVSGTSRVWYDQRPSWTAYGIVILQYTTTANKLTVFIGDNNNSAWEVSITGSTTLVAGNWHYVKLTREGSTFTLWLDGVSQGAGTFAGTINVGTSNLLLGIGRNADNSVLGYMDCVRITKGIARSGSHLPSGSFPTQ